MQFYQLKHFADGERRHAASVQLCPSLQLGRRRFMLGTAAALAVGNCQFWHKADMSRPRVPYHSVANDRCC